MDVALIPVIIFRNFLLSNTFECNIFLFLAVFISEQLIKLQ